jgi:hypothetical protein
MATGSARTWRLGVLGVATAAAIAGVGAAPVANAVSDDDRIVTVTNEGDPTNRVMLSTTPAVGDAARLGRDVRSIVTAESTETSMSLDASSRTHVQRHVAVQSVDPDGEYATLVTVESFDQTVDDRFGVRDDFEGFFPTDLTPIVGVTLVQHYDAGNLLEFAEPATGTSLTPEQDDVVDTLPDESVEFPLITPDTPVGQGATWVVSPPEPFAAMSPFAVGYELISVKGDRFLVDMSFQFDLAELGDLMFMPPEVEELSGEMTGGAQFSSIFDAPLLTSTSFQMRMDMAMSVEGVDLSMTLDYLLDETATPA